MQVLDLFSGIGGFALGLERAGMQTVAFCEVEPFRRLVLQLHWPDVPILPDIRTTTGESLRLAGAGDIDLICGGFPCQDISTAGKGAGLNGRRSGLFWEAHRLIEELRPRWVLLENVPALRTRGADDVLGALEGLGYACWPLVVGAWAVGSPQRRNRVWIVGRLADANKDELRQQPGRGGGTCRPETPESGGGGERVGHAPQGAGSSVASGAPEGEQGAPGGSGGVHLWPAGRGAEQHPWEPPRTIPASQPGLGRSAAGLPCRLARRAHRLALEALGDTVVPQVVEAVGKAILSSELAISQLSRPASGSGPAPARSP